MTRATLAHRRIRGIVFGITCLLTGAAVARNNFDGPRVNSIKGHFSRIAVAYPHFVCLHR